MRFNSFHLITFINKYPRMFQLHFQNLFSFENFVLIQEFNFSFNFDICNFHKKASLKITDVKENILIKKPNYHKIRYFFKGIFIIKKKSIMMKR